MNQDVTCILQPLVDAHWDGTSSTADEKRMRAHLPNCDACRDYYDRHALLAEIDPSAADGVERMGRALGLRESEQASRLRMPSGPILLLVGALAALLAVVLRTRFEVPGRDEGFAARSGHACLANVRVLRVDGDTLVPVTTEVNRIDELGFSVKAPAAELRYVMIYGVTQKDANPRVVWFAPAWKSESETPTSVEIPRDRGSEWPRLPHVLRHELEGGTLEIHALFSARPFNVREVETSLARHPRAIEGLNAPASEVFEDVCSIAIR